DGRVTTACRTGSALLPAVLRIELHALGAGRERLLEQVEELPGVVAHVLDGVEDGAAHVGVVALDAARCGELLVGEPTEQGRAALDDGRQPRQELRRVTTAGRGELAGAVTVVGLAADAGEQPEAEV